MFASEEYNTAMSQSVSMSLHESSTCLLVTSRYLKALVYLLQDASSLLYLCVMLRKQPRVETGMVTLVNGSRFFDLYIPSLGLESRININEILPPVDASWDPSVR